MKKLALGAMLTAMLFLLSGCFIQPDPMLDPLVITEGAIPFGTVQPLPTQTPTPAPVSTPTPTPDSWQASDQSTWEDWAQESLPASTPRKAATAAPDAQSWMTSTQDYNAGYPVLMMGSTGSDVSICRRGCWSWAIITAASTDAMPLRRSVPWRNSRRDTASRRTASPAGRRRICSIPARHCPSM